MKLLLWPISEWSMSEHQEYLASSTGSIEQKELVAVYVKCRLELKGAKVF